MCAHCFCELPWILLLLAAIDAPAGQFTYHQSMMLSFILIFQILLLHRHPVVILLWILICHMFLITAFCHFSQPSYFTGILFSFHLCWLSLLLNHAWPLESHGYWVASASSSLYVFWALLSSSRTLALLQLSFIQFHLCIMHQLLRYTTSVSFNQNKSPLSKA